MMAADVAAIHVETAGPAQDVSYTPHGGAAAPIKGVLVRTGQSEEAFPDGVYEVETAQLVVLVSDVPVVTLLQDKVDVPQVDGSGTETWYVRSIYAQNPAVRELVLMKQIRKRMIGEGQEASKKSGAAPHRTL